MAGSAVPDQRPTDNRILDLLLSRRKELSQSAIARQLGLSNEYIARCLAHLSSQGLVTYRRKRFLAFSWLVWQPSAKARQV